MGAFVISPVPPFLMRNCQQQGSFARRALPRFLATPNPSATLSSSADFPVVPVIRPTQLPPLSRRDEEGFSSCSTRPSHRAVAPTPPEQPAASASLRRPVLPSPAVRRFGLQS